MKRAVMGEGQDPYGSVEAGSAAVATIPVEAARASDRAATAAMGTREASRCAAARSEAKRIFVVCRREES